MPPGDRARTVLVRDADDSVMTRRLLDIVDDIDRGVIVVRPIPGESDRETFALSVLYALGKHVDQKAAFSLRGLCWWFAETWLAGHRITTAVVDRLTLCRAGCWRTSSRWRAAPGPMSGSWTPHRAPPRR